MNLTFSSVITNPLFLIEFSQECLKYQELAIQFKPMPVESTNMRKKKKQKFHDLSRRCFNILYYVMFTSLIKFSTTLFFPILDGRMRRVFSKLEINVHPGIYWGW